MNRKEVALKIRVDEELRREFVNICRAGDMTAAQVVRHFMRDYIVQQRKGMQGNLFSHDSNKGSV